MKYDVNKTPRAEEIIIEIQLTPGSIQTFQLEERIDAFAVVKDVCRDIMYVRVEAAETIQQQARDTAEVIKGLFDEYRTILQGLGITFYFNKKFHEKWKMRQVEQSYTVRLQENLGDRFHREYYNSDEDLKLEFRFNSVSLQEHAEEQSQKTA